MQVERGGSLVVKGTAPTHQAVAAYLEALRRQPELAGMGLHASERSEPGAPVTFVLQATLPRAGTPAGSRPGAPDEAAPPGGRER